MGTTTDDNTKNEMPINGFNKENVAGIIKYVGSKEDFLKFAQDLAVKIYGTDIPVVAEKPTLHLYKTTCTMYIIGTVNGVLRNEIIFYKNDLQSQTEDGKQRESTGTGG